MSSNLVPLSYKPGVQRDGTTFQGDYCLDGQWIRFQRGKIKKIRGMKGLNVNTDLSVASEIVLLPFNAGQIYYYIASDIGIYGGTVDSEFNNTGNVTALTTDYNNPVVQWQAEKVIRNKQSIMVFLATNNATDIAQNTPSPIYYGAVGQPLTLLDSTANNVKPQINGGMCYSSPYLFLYGSNGIVQYSKSNDPLNFIADDSPEKGGEIPISNDKVIYGKAIRAGANDPSVLFWTLSSVVGVSNVGTTTIELQKNVLSETSSILSSKCVVGYDGFFFWPGTDRFFVYNGTVQELTNNINLNYFYDNIDMNYRHKVFGVKNTKYGEIWWFYPEKVGTPGRNPALPAGFNTRALIYNKRENSWYDTVIYRESGVFVDDFGYLVTYGRSLCNPTFSNQKTFLWRHEYQTKEHVPNVPELDNPIISSVTTPVFGWACFNPVYGANGQKGQPVDRWIEIKRIEPDFVLKPDDAMTVVVNTQEYAQSPVISSTPISFNKSIVKIDLRVHGRQMSLTFSSGNDFEIGTIMMLVGIGDGQ